MESDTATRPEVSHTKSYWTDSGMGDSTPASFSGPAGATASPSGAGDTTSSYSGSQEPSAFSPFTGNTKVATTLRRAPLLAKMFTMTSVSVSGKSASTENLAASPNLILEAPHLAFFNSGTWTSKLPDPGYPP